MPRLNNSSLATDQNFKSIFHEHLISGLFEMRMGGIFNANMQADTDLVSDSPPCLNR